MSQLCDSTSFQKSPDDAQLMLSGCFGHTCPFCLKYAALHPEQPLTSERLNFSVGRSWDSRIGGSWVTGWWNSSNSIGMVLSRNELLVGQVGLRRSAASAHLLPHREVDRSSPDASGGDARLVVAREQAERQHDAQEEALGASPELELVSAVSTLEHDVSSVVSMINVSGIGDVGAAFITLPEWRVVVAIQLWLPGQTRERIMKPDRKHCLELNGLRRQHDTLLTRFTLEMRVRTAIYPFHDDSSVVPLPERAPVLDQAIPADVLGLLRPREQSHHHVDLPSSAAHRL